MYLRSGAPVLNRIATLHHLFLAQIEYYFSLFKKTFLLALSYLISPVPLEPRRRPPGGFGGAGEPPRAPAGSDPGPRAQTGDAGRARGVWRHREQTVYVYLDLYETKCDSVRRYDTHYGMYQQYAKSLAAQMNAAIFVIRAFFPPVSFASLYRELH